MQKLKKAGVGWGVGVLLLSFAGYYGLARCAYIPRRPREIASQFIEQALSGHFEEAYKMTDHAALVGRTPSSFESTVRHQLGLETLPAHRDVQFVRFASGYQSYGNRFRRWLKGRKMDPDEIILDYYVGMPFSINLRSDGQGQWRITFFESHAA